MGVVLLKNSPKDRIRRIFHTHWGSSEMVISTGVYDCSELEGFVYLDELDEIIGLVTYQVQGKTVEIISLDSMREGQGIGTMLIQKVEEQAEHLECSRMKLMTTNDNLHALKFYQKRGFSLVAVHRNAVDIARERKPEIPQIGSDGIPIRDEIELDKIINRRMEE